MSVQWYKSCANFKKISPFCFGRHIFLNKSDYQNKLIDPDIISHESVHARHFHTVDVLIIEFLLIFYWFNPLLWCFRYLIKSNHEYCADDLVVRTKSNLVEYSNKLVSFIRDENYPLHASGFNYSLVKGRIVMMDRVRSSSASFGRKLFVCFVALTFTVNTTSFQIDHIKPNIPGDSSVFTVVIDAGHGGKDHGASTLNKAILEKDLVLAISQAIVKRSPDPSVRIILTRDTDVMMTLSDRVQIAKANGADLFISLHVNSHYDSTLKGLEVYYSEQNLKSNLSKEYCAMFANGITLNGSKPAAMKMGDFVVLNDSDCPAVLLEMGFISNTHDLQFLSSKTNLQSLAKQIARIILEISKI